MDEYDSPWKEIIEFYFPEFMEFFFPKAYQQIDWDAGFEFLDKEFQQIVKDADLGKRLADKLVKVWKKDGSETWVLIHIEIEGRSRADFAKRMFTYNYRIFDRYDRPVASFAVLTDSRKNWRPDNFGYNLFGCEVNIKFPVAKLIDYSWDELEKGENPFAIVIMAHLKNLETRRNADMRKAWKLKLTRMLYEKGYAKQDIINIFAFIDWVMKLPREAEQSFWQEIHEFEEEKNMPYVTSIERMGFERGMEAGILQGIMKGKEEGIKEGIKKGLRDAIELGLSLKFGANALKLMAKIKKTDDVDLLEAIKEAIKTANDISEIEILLED